MTPNEVEEFIQTNRKICWESEFENGEYCIGESKVKLFLIKMLNDQTSEIKMLQSRIDKASLIAYALNLEDAQKEAEPNEANTQNEANTIEQVRLAQRELEQKLTEAIRIFRNVTGGLIPEINFEVYDHSKNIKTFKVETRVIL